MFRLFKNKGKAQFTGGYILMPIRHRIFLWIVSFVILAATASVWWMAFAFRAVIMTGAWVPSESFALIFLGYHVLMMVVSLVGWGMQNFWHTDEVMGLFPIALGIGTIALVFASWQLWLVCAMVNLSG